MSVLPTLRLDRRSDVPLQRQLFEALRAAIVDGTLKPGTQLPPTRDLAAALRVSRNCAINAFRYLAAHGLVTARSGAGTRVADVAHRRSRVPPSSRSRRGRTGRIARIVTDASSGTAGAFRPGVPAIDLFPSRTWRAILGRIWSKSDAALLAYNDVHGFRPLRDAIAAHLGVARGIRCDGEQVVIVHGAQHATDLVARVLLEPSDVACCEDPGYLGARSAFAATGASVVPLAVDAWGLNVAAARARVASPRLVHVTPSHQYPTGVTMSLERRHELLEWCAESGAWIVEDDYGGSLRRDGRELPAIHALARNAAVMYIGSFSHVLAPALRLGYLIVPYDVLDAFRVVLTVAGRGPSVVEQAAMAEFITAGHFDRHLRRLRDAYAERQRVLLEYVERLTPRAILGIDAGSHVVVQLQSPAEERRLSRMASARGIEIPLVRAYGNADGLVFGYGSTSPAAIAQAMAMVVKVGN